VNHAPISITASEHDSLLEPYAPRCAVLMPSFGGCSFRAENQRTVLRWYRERNFQVIQGRDTQSRNGFFSRARAINAAVRLSPKEKDIFILADNDLIPSVPHLAKALYQLEHHKVITPHCTTLHSSFAGRQQLLAGNKTMLYAPKESGSRSYVVIRRQAFEAMNGMDEVFEGWGPEDKAFLISANKHHGGVLELDGERIHLWHPADQSKRDRTQLMKNRERCKQYEAASPKAANVLAREYGPLYP